MRRRFTALSIAVPGDEPPSEFRIFTAGAVETTKGEFVFDALSAESVMAEYRAHGVDLMIDYDHASLKSISLDPAQAGKAAGWFNLEVRNGELWAVNVRWTEPAANALRAKEWRFMSPAFQADEGRIVSVLNVAITNMPATRRLEPLVAASTNGDSGMDPNLIKEALDALIAGDDAKCAELLKSLVAAAAGGTSDSADDSSPDSSDGSAPDPTAAAATTDAKAPPPPAEKKADVAASIARLMSLSGATSFVELANQFETYRESHLKHESVMQKLAAERALFEAAERRKGCADLVVLGGRKPATVWANDAATEPKKYLAAMPIADFKEYVSDAIKANGGGKKSVLAPPVHGTASKSGAHGLSAAELRICEDMKCSPENFAALKAMRDSVKTGGV